MINAAVDRNSTVVPAWQSARRNIMMMIALAALLIEDISVGA